MDLETDELPPLTLPIGYYILDARVANINPYIMNIAKSVSKVYAEKGGHGLVFKCNDLVAFDFYGQSERAESFALDQLMDYRGLIRQGLIQLVEDSVNEDKIYYRIEEVC